MKTGTIADFATPAGRRRRFVRTVAALPLAALLGAFTGCGFKLRGAQELPFASIYLGFGPNSAFGAELARNIRASTSTQIALSPGQAKAVLELLGESRDRDVLSLNAEGRAREYQLRYRLAFRLHDGQGREFIGPTELRAQRDVTFNDALVLAKESEEALLYRDMQTDVVQQLLRRIAAARPTPVAPAGP